MSLVTHLLFNHTPTINTGTRTVLEGLTAELDADVVAVLEDDIVATIEDEVECG